MPGVTKEQIAQAKEIDLLSYLQANEPYELVRSGPNEYRTTSHHRSQYLFHNKIAIFAVSKYN